MNILFIFVILISLCSCSDSNKVEKNKLPKDQTNVQTKKQIVNEQGISVSEIKDSIITGKWHWKADSMQVSDSKEGDFEFVEYELGALRGFSIINAGGGKQLKFPLIGFINSQTGKFIFEIKNIDPVYNVSLTSEGSVLKDQILAKTMQSITPGKVIEYTWTAKKV